MHAPVAKRVARAGLVIAGSVALAALGCDNPRAGDERVREATEAAAVAQLDGKSEQALKLLERAAADRAASPASQAHANASLARAEFDLAVQQIQQVTDGHRQIARLTTEISGLGAQIAAFNLRIAGYRQEEPDELRTQIAQRIAEAQGGPGRDQWFEFQGMSVPSLTAVSQQISRLEGEIAQKQEQIRQLEDQRGQALRRADELAEQADQSKGQQSVDVFKQSADSRRQGDKLGIEIDQLQASVIPLQRELAGAQQQRTIAESAIAHYQQQLVLAEQAWTNVESQIDAQTSLVSLVAAGEGTAPVESSGDAAEGAEAPTTQPARREGISEKATALSQVSAQTEQAAQTAVRYLENAITHYDQAGTQAETALRQLAGSKPAAGEARDAQEVFKKVLNPAVYRLGKADAQHSLAALQASRAAALRAQGDLARTLAPIYEAAGLTLPESMSAEQADADQATAADAAAEQYAAAQELYVTVAGAPGASEETRNAALVGRMLALYRQALLARAIGETEQAESLLADAITARDDAIREEAALPSLPSELSPPPPEPTTAPAATQAAPAPATRAAQTQPARPGQPAAQPARPGQAPAGQTPARPAQPAPRQPAAR